MFSLEGKFFRGLTKIGDFLILGILGIIFSLPLITIGTSLTSMFYVGMKLVKNEEGYVAKDFWRSFKSNLKQGIIIELIIAVAAVVLVQNVRICLWWASEEGSLIPQLIMYATFGLILVLIGISIYAFPLLAKFQNTVVGTLKNGLLLCMKHLPQTFIMLLCNVGITYYSLAYFPVFILTIPFMCYVDSYIMTRVFAPYTKQSQVEADFEDSEGLDKAESTEE